MNTVTPLAATAIGALLPFLIQYLKKAPWFTWLSVHDHGKARAASVLLSAISALFVAGQTGSLDAGPVNDVISAGLTFAQTIGVSTTVYHYFVKT